MRKKAHDNYDINFLKLPHDDSMSDDTSVHIVGDYVFIETTHSSIMLSRAQAKLLTNYLHDRIVRPVDNMFGDN